jgi:uncharacterized membrane protein YqjE
MDTPARPEASAAAQEPRQALRGLVAAGMEVVRTRLDLAAVELELHLLALVRMLVWVIGALACALLALAFGVTALIAALWDTHRMAALLGGSLVFVGLAAVFGFLGARSLGRRGNVFEGSLQQLHEDTRRFGGSS